MEGYRISCLNSLDSERCWTPIDSMLYCFTILKAICDENGKIIDFLLEYVNDDACKFKKKSREDLLGKRLLAAFPDTKYNGLFHEFCKVVETGKSFSTKVLVQKNSSRGKAPDETIELNASRMNDCCAVNWHLIKESSYDEMDFQESEEKFRTAFENASIGMALTSVDGRWLKVNKSLCEMVGYTESEMLQMTFFDMTHEEDIGHNLKCFDQSIEGKINNYNIDKRFIHKDGHVVWTNLSSSLIRNSRGEPLYFSSQIQDISIIKQAIVALEHDKLKNEFFANLSHELRTPTTIILSSLQLLSHYADSGNLQTSSIKKYISVMKQNCYRLVRLTNNLIDATKIDAGFYELHLQNCNIVNIVENITMSVADYVSSKGLSLQLETDVKEKIIACDPDMIERIILNLLSNAVKFTKSNGKINVHLSDKGNDFEIIVKDNGMGIRKDKQKLIFERFRQADKSLTRKREGSGIGLSLVKALVEMHGGSISLKSTFGRGSEFTITFPSALVQNQDHNASHWKLKNEKDFIERINIEFSDIYI